MLAGADDVGDYEHRHAETAGGQLIEGRAQHAGHVGIATPGGLRNG